MNPVRTFQSNQPRVTLTGLSPCLSYWVVVTAVDCTNRVSSAPRLIGLADPVDFKMIISESTVSCGAWIADNSARKLSDILNKMNDALESRCGMSVPCMANSRFTCGNDPSAVTFE